MNSILKGILYLIVLMVIFLVGSILVWMIVPSILIGVNIIQPGPGFQEMINQLLLVYVIVYWVFVIVFFIYRRKSK